MSLHGDRIKQRLTGGMARQVHVEVIRNFYGPSESDKVLAKLRAAHAQFKKALKARTSGAGAGARRP